MPVRVAINGFGRIGRNTFKAAFGRLKDLEFVAVNDLTDTKTLAHLLKHDTNYGHYEHDVKHDEQNVIVDGKKIRVYAEKDPTKLPWGKEKIDVVLECTGRFTDEAGAGQHITAGAKRVIISAPAKGGNVPTHVLGVNPEGAGKAKVINNASCTTNCIAPVAAILHEAFGIKKALMTTTHGYTADQNLQDGPHKDLRRARAAAANIVPTSTGAAIAVAEAIPELKGLFDGLALRVPVSVVSLADFTFLLKKKTSAEEINALFRKAAKSPRWKGVLDVTDEPLVSSDFIKNSYSSIVDLGLTKVVDGDFVKVVAWYDNEWGYSCRLGEMALHVGKSLTKK
ncbi:MAG TPA: type I glyceraldehyde-3-phosphate dehydrogenase [Candidatus Eisenbacteria bacterium]|jgi:glyceraldehyde 3-phosphate dehydrogenase|nr:type I glyceraldehyde-3-phosphate dehydrogenase [Candidatus Eisenbacteria bacterium]